MSMTSQKSEVIRSRGIRESARGQACTVRSPVCNGDTDTTVWAHSNFAAHGKGMGHKASDLFGCYACAACHMWLDAGPASRQEKELAFLRAWALSLAVLVDLGIVSVREGGR